MVLAKQLGNSQASSLSSFYNVAMLSYLLTTTVMVKYCLQCTSYAVYKNNNKKTINKKLSQSLILSSYEKSGGAYAPQAPPCLRP